MRLVRPPGGAHDLSLSELIRSVAWLAAMAELL